MIFLEKDNLKNKVKNKIRCTTRKLHQNLLKENKNKTKDGLFKRILNLGT